VEANPPASSVQNGKKRFLFTLTPGFTTSVHTGGISVSDKYYALCEPGIVLQITLLKSCFIEIDGGRQ